MAKYKMHFKALLIVCIMQILYRQIQATGKYTVIGPGSIHSDSKYTVAVAVHHTSEPCDIKVGITGPSYNKTETVKLNPGQIENIDFNVPPLESGLYNLTAQGINCLDNFFNTTKLNYAKYNNHVFIQTDKGVYKPGDTINYRVLFLDKDLKPTKPEKNAKIWFQDGKLNRIKEINDIEVTKGVYTGKLKISEQPVTGGWRIGVTNGDTYDQQQYFDVDKYVLPKFVVKVEATDRVSVKDGDIQITVRANYTYGKPLNGKVTVIINSENHHLHFYYDRSSEMSEDENRKDPPTIIRTANMVNGKAKIDTNIKIYEPYIHNKILLTYLNILATVEEEFTGVKMNSTTVTTVYPYRYSMHCVNYETCSSFQADKEAKVLLRLSYVDNTNLNDTKEPVELIYTEVLRKYRWWYRNEEMDSDTDEKPVSENRVFHFTAKMNETGFAEFSVKLPDLKEYHHHGHFYKMEAKYRDEQRELFSTYQYREPKNVRNPDEEEPKEPQDFFRIEYKHYSETPKIGEMTQFVVNSSRPLPYLDYNVIARGNIIESQHIELPDQPMHYNITATPTYKWAPNFAIYVYYVDDKGEYHHAEQINYMEAKLQNEINITAPEQVKPGDNVTLNIKTAKNSFVGLMAVDQSVLLLHSNNDLSIDQLKWILNSYRTFTPYQGGYSYYPGTSSGVVTLTNANYFYNWTMPIYFSVPLHSMAYPHVANDRIYTKTAAHDSSTLEASTPSGHTVAGFAAAGAPGKPNIKVRKDFSETWIFDNIENTETEKFEWIKQIPDTITSWVITGFAMNNETGLGITESKTNIVTFQPFFISIRLPYSVKLGEVINVPALVFNYLTKDLDVDVTLNNDADEYEFMDITNEVLNDQKQITKSIHVPANGASGISFMLRPKVVGNVMLKYTAVSALAGDSIHKTMKVVPPGVTQHVNRAYLIQLKDQPEFNDKFELEFPEDVVPASQYVEVGVMGDLLGPVLNHLDGLIRKPTGCGEQTMSKLIPNYLVMKYLQHVKKLTPSLETTLKYNMEIGYQNMLKFRQKDGSFATFSSDKELSGSTWLTAYVIHGLQNVANYVNVDSNIIENGLEFLANNQAENGSFTDKGNFYYNGNHDAITLTSFTLLAFLKNQTLADLHSKVVNKGLEYIVQNMDNSKSLKDKALGTYVLSESKHSQASESLRKLRELVKNENDRKWWSSKNQDNEKMKRWWWYYVHNNDVEITSYALLSLLGQDSIDINEILPIIRWLIGQRNSYGGFSSTQDTVVGLTALIKFAEKTNYEPGKMEITFEAGSSDGKSQKETMQITDENGLLYQTVEMPPKTNAVAFTAKGTGTALVQISYQYNIYEKEPKPSFEITTKKYDENLAGKLMMEVCVQYTGDGNASNMALLEISLPSGFVVDDDIIKDLQEIQHVSNVEVKNSNSLLVVYFDHLYKNVIKCIPVEAFRSHAVALQKPASIILYDYYDSDRKVTVFYDINTKLCDICDGEEECNKCRMSH